MTKEIDPESGVVAPFRMPLHPESMMTVGVANRFDDPVRRPCHDLETPGIGDRLTVVTVDLPAAQRSLDRMGRAVPVGVRGRKGVGKVLVERAAGVKTHQLHSQADGEKGKPGRASPHPAGYGATQPGIGVDL